MSGHKRACIYVDDEMAAVMDALGDTRAEVLRHALYEYLTQSTGIELMNQLRENSELTSVTEVTVQTPPADTPSNVTSVAEAFYTMGYEDALDDIEAEMEAKSATRLQSRDQAVVDELVDQSSDECLATPIQR